jgi:hypothetical protein
MKTLLLALAALLAGVAFIPAAHADDCDPDDGAVEFARCIASKAVPMVIPAPAGSPAMIGKLCDPDEDDDCVRRLAVPGARRYVPSGPSGVRPRAAVKDYRDRRIAAGAKPDTPAPAAPETSPAKASADAGDGPVCTRYLPNLGKSVVIPCVE